MEEERANECRFCGGMVDNIDTYCKHCGQFLRSIPREEFKYEDMYDLADNWKSNLELFKKIMRSDDDVEALQEQINIYAPGVLEQQRKLTKMVLESFPVIRELIRRDEAISFHAKIVQMPYRRESGEPQHECIQQALANKQDGLINLSLGFQKISQQISMTEFPVWAPEGVGETILQKLKSILDTSFPDGQKELLISAEPVFVCNRVYGYEGRWVTWRLLYNTSRLTSWYENHNELPLNFPFFSGLKYYRLFPIAGTKSEGEIMLALVDGSEESRFNNTIAMMKEKFGFECKPLRRNIIISWQTLHDLGFLGINPVNGDSTIFTSRLLEIILARSLSNFSTFAEESSVRPEEKDKKRYIISSAKEIINDITLGQLYDRIFDVIQPIPDSLREKYTIKFRG